MTAMNGSSDDKSKDHTEISGTFVVRKWFNSPVPSIVECQRAIEHQGIPVELPGGLFGQNVVSDVELGLPSELDVVRHDAHVLVPARIPMIP